MNPDLTYVGTDELVDALCARCDALAIVMVRKMGKDVESEIDYYIDGDLLQVIGLTAALHRNALGRLQPAARDRA